MAADAVFISYSRARSAAQAAALRDALTAAGASVFLDTQEIPPGGAFPKHLAAALLAARVVVVFAEEAYFQRTWCAHEFRVVTAGFRAAGQDLDHVVVALPATGGPGGVVSYLPPPLAESSWPTAAETPVLAALVQERPARNPRTIEQRLAGLDDDALATLRDGALVPAAALPHPKLVAPHGLPASLKERFVGRAETLWAIFSALETRGAEQARRSCLLQGTAGMGKSQLAAEYAARYGVSHYPGGVVWIDASADAVDLPARFTGRSRRSGGSCSTPPPGFTGASKPPRC